MKEDRNNGTFIEEIPNIALIPNHGKMEALPSYPLCAKREIFCGPNLQNKDTIERKYIQTNGRFFNIDDVISQLDKKDQRIDLIFAPLEVNVACFPKNLFRIKCPKVAYIFDTHHLLYSISSILEYTKRERFTNIFIYAQPAHLHFFYEAGLTHTAAFRPILQNIETSDNKKLGVTYIGHRWSSAHLRRSRMVHFLEKQLPKNNIPFHHYDRLPRQLWLKVLGRSRIIVISSLNGQLTPQIVSCLSAGALCFIDELSPKTFLYRFFEPGKHIVTWSNFTDLLEKLIYYNNHPEEAEVIAKAGQTQVKKDYTISKHFALTISEFVFENKIDSRFLAINDKRCQNDRIERPEYFNARIRLYENIQELHRIHKKLYLISLTKENLKPSADLADLPRLDITHAFNSEASKNKAELFFENCNVNNQIKTILLPNIKKTKLYDIGILEKKEIQPDWSRILNLIKRILKRNSLLWVFGKLDLFELELFKKEGFRPYQVKKFPAIIKIKRINRKVCLFLWKIGLYPFPYLTLKPAMETVSYLNVFLRGWQSYLPFLF